jgi:hypothetical protein
VFASGFFCGAETFVDIARFGEKKIDLLRRFRPFRDGRRLSAAPEDLSLYRLGLPGSFTYAAINRRRGESSVAVFRERTDEATE